MSKPAAGADTTEPDEQGSTSDPDLMPLFPGFRASLYGWIEAKRVRADGKAQSKHAIIPRRFKCNISEIAIAEELGGGTFTLYLKNRSGDIKTQREIGVEAPEKEWKMPASGGGWLPSAGLLGEGGAGDLFGGMAKLIEASGGNRGSCPSCAGTLLSMQAMVRAADESTRANNAHLEFIRKIATETETALRDRVNKLETRVHDKELETLQLTKLLLEKAGGTSQWVKDLKEAAPIIKPQVEKIIAKWKGADPAGDLSAGPGAAPQLPEIEIPGLPGIGS